MNSADDQQGRVTGCRGGKVQIDAQAGQHIMVQAQQQQQQQQQLRRGCQLSEGKGSGQQLQVGSQLHGSSGTHLQQAVVI